MNRWAVNSINIAILLAEVIAGIWMSTIIWLYATWAVNPKLANEFETWNWWEIGLKRGLICIMSALLISGAIWALNQQFFEKRYGLDESISKGAPFICAGMATLTSLLGVIHFISTKPLMY